MEAYWENTKKLGLILCKQLLQNSYEYFFEQLILSQFIDENICIYIFGPYKYKMSKVSTDNICETGERGFLRQGGGGGDFFFIPKPRKFALICMKWFFNHTRIMLVFP